MKLQSIFAKPIDRNIEGVIKPDDKEHLLLEVEEYVVTNEIAKSMTQFFGAYNEYQGAPGVWISGFFGSGKSHLLKMLSHLLENKILNGKVTLDYFDSKIQDAFLKAEMKKAVSIPSKSILFNIDQKADTIDKSETDAVLSVFVKVFNEMQGYYGKHGYVAQFEKDLASRGIYEGFKDAYQDISGIPWEKGREQAIFEKDSIAKAYASVSDSTEDSQKNIVDAYRSDYKLSIEDFAEQVNDYIQKQEPSFRLNFLVDEVGQYIAENVKYMTNLQTISESLATKCNGQSWIIVTAQEDMNTVLGELGKQQTDDFSKIQARFKTRMKLTNQNVDEVIQKRLLKKNADGEKLTEKLYGEKKNNFGTLFDFADGATKYRNFKDKEHFRDCYPFIPYQFTLFQTSIESFSDHNAFEGRHSSVGARSMLEVFQDVIVTIKDREIGELATFDLMFEGIRATLKSQIQQSILNAENHLDNLYAIRVLKALFLVKYIRGFNATPRNLRVLLQSGFDQDIPSLRKDIVEALNLLEQQTYIQRNGETYEYLTDEEKDIEEEIKRTTIDSSEIQKDLGEILFSGIIRDPKIRYDVTKQDYRFTKKLDDKIIGKDYELAIHFISPFSENVDQIKTLQGHSFGRPELMVVFPPEARLVQDLLLYKRTGKYIQLNVTTQKNDVILNILSSKGRQNTDRFRDIQNRVGELIGSARFFVAGEEVEISGEDPKTRIIKGFDELVVRTYPHLKMLRGVTYSENDIKSHIDFSKTASLDSDLNEAEREVFAFIQSNKKIGTLSTIKSLEEHFTKKPYGWYLAAVQCIVAILAGRGKIDVKSDANLLEGTDLEHALKNTHGFGNIIIDPVITTGDPKVLKDFFNKYFDHPCSSNEARSIAIEILDAFKEFLGDLKALAAQKSQYPFLGTLEEPIEDMKGIVGKDYSYIIKEFPEKMNLFLDKKETILDPIRRFMSGAGKNIYDDASHFMQTQNANFDAVGDGKPDQLRKILAAEDCYQGNQMRDAKKLMEELKKEVDTKLEEEKSSALSRAKELHGRVVTMPDFDKLEEDQKSTVDQSFEDIEYKIKEQPLIAVVRDRIGQYESKEYIDLLNQISKWLKKDEKEYISISELDVKLEKSFLENETDVDSYLQALKKVVLKKIKENKIIRL